jgi:hypothetical protein
MNSDRMLNSTIPAAPHTAPPARLLILGCSKAKTKHDELVPAIQRYDGPPFRVLRRYLRLRYDPVLRVYILSAEYGIIPTDALIPDYDRRMTPARSKQIRRHVLDTLTHLLNGSDILPHDPKHVLVVLGKVYRDVLTGYAGNGSEWLLNRCVSGRPGQRLTQLKTWLYVGSQT